jgi:antirestriction protein ArdC
MYNVYYIEVSSVKTTGFILFYKFQPMKIYDILVDQIIEKLEQGVIPWKQWWIGWIPCNYISKTSYRWFNKLVLSLNDFADSRYLTPKQIKKLWWNIIKWSKWTKIYFFKLNKANETIDDSNLKESYPMIRYYNVFNVEQTEWIELEKIEVADVSTQLFKAQDIVIWYKDKPNIKSGVNASYNLLSDVITIPSLIKFTSNEEYFATLFHELVHSTWSDTRLNRFWLKQVEHYWSDTYSKEELIAELGSMFLCMKAWIINKTWENSKNYIAWWLRYIKWNKKDLITASTQAEKAVSYITE